MWHGQYSPGFKVNKLKSFSRGKIDQNHVDKRILGGKGLQYEDSRSITFVLPVRYGTGVALTLSAVIGQPKKTQKVTLRYGTGVALTLSAVIGQPNKTQQSHWVTAKVLH